MHSSIDIWLEVEKKCNLNCKFCYNYWKDNLTPLSILSSKELIRCLQKLFDRVKCNKITLSGGEPLEEGSY